MTPDPFWNAFGDNPERERRTPRTVLPSPEERQQQKRIAQLFLGLWDKAVGTSGYEKGEWMELQNFLQMRLPGVFCVEAPLGGGSVDSANAASPTRRDPREERQHKELEELRKFQAQCMVDFRGPERDWYHTEGAWMGMADALAEECMILQEIKEGKKT